MSVSSIELEEQLVVIIDDTSEQKENHIDAGLEQEARVCGQGPDSAHR